MCNPSYIFNGNASKLQVYYSMKILLIVSSLITLSFKELLTLVSEKKVCTMYV